MHVSNKLRAGVKKVPLFVEKAKGKREKVHGSGRLLHFKRFQAVCAPRLEEKEPKMELPPLLIRPKTPHLLMLSCGWQAL